MYIVLEIQTMVGGTVAVLTPIIKASREEAESVYHSILSYAAVSSIPMHAAVIMTNEGIEIARQSYTHLQEVSEE